MNQIQVELQGSFGDDRTISNAAWTSSTDYQKKKSKTDEQVKDLIIKLANEGHAVPFEHVVFRFWIKLPIQTDRQWMTHRIQSTSGMSGRYRTMPSDYLDIPNDVEDIINKFKCECGDPDSPVFLDLFESYYYICEDANNLYRIALESAKKAEKENLITNKEYKRLREFYRGILPQNNMTERVTTINLRSFCNVQRLRNSEHAQLEIKQIAELMLEEVKKSNICPVAIEILEKNGWII